MISINSSFVSTAKMTDLSVVSVCSLDVPRPALLATDGSSFTATRLSGAGRISPVTLPVTGANEGGNERPIKALAAEVAAAEATAYAFAAAGAELKKQTKQHHTMWAIRGPEPWRDPA